ncbi:helix-turn-helix domain-containing protein [Microbispora sp. NPDC049633]|uniref:helix-turn-helix domain-containing protein n=1 Tax=Microbispora sp. NPDC049633 TaxID=3154355 RepID=UPI003437DE0D
MPQSSDVCKALEMLAQEAPPSAFDELIRVALRGGADPTELKALIHARGVALRIHSITGRRQQREAGLSALVEAARDLHAIHDLDPLLTMIVRRARTLLNLDMAYLSFLDPVAGDAYVRAADGHVTGFTVGFRVPRSGGLGRLAAESVAPFWTADYLADDRIRHVDVIDEVIRAEGLHAVMAVPLRHGGAPLGVLYAADRQVRHFTPDEVALMGAFGDFAASAVEKVQLLAEARSAVVELEWDMSQLKADVVSVSQANDAHLRILDVLLSGGDVATLAALVSETSRGPLRVLGADGTTLAAAGEVPMPDEDELLGALMNAYATGAPVALDGVWVDAITAGSENLGTVLLGVERLDESGVQSLRFAARAFAVLILMRSNSSIAEVRVRDDVFDDLLAAPGPSRAAGERAHRLGLTLDGPHVIVVGAPQRGQQNRAFIWASSYASRVGGLKSRRGDMITLLLPGSDAGAVARAVSAELEPLLGSPVTIGAAGPVSNLGEIARAYEEAVRCLDAVAAVGGRGTVASVEDLGFLGVLLADTPDVSGFVDRAVGRVLEYDTQNGTSLLRTLEAHFDAAGSPTRAAAVLHVHPNTVSRRLERIGDLLGPDWQEPARSLEIQLALRLHRARNVLSRAR